MPPFWSVWSPPRGPIAGRSITYRFGAFHAISHAALTGNLSASVMPAQVRCALLAEMERTEKGGMFDESGFLRAGAVGVQPGLGEDYICVGSAYLCTAVFLPLGLSPEHPFWAVPDEDWTGRKVWPGAGAPGTMRKTEDPTLRGIKLHRMKR